MIKRTLILTLALATSLSAAPAHAQGAATPPLLSVTLPNNPKLDTTLNLKLPNRTELGTVLTAITRAAGLDLITRDIPRIPVTANLDGSTVRAALQQLLSLYRDQIDAALIDNTLVVAPPQILTAFRVTPAPERRMLSVTLTDATAARISAVTGAQIIPLTDTVLISGTAAQVGETATLLQSAKPSMDSTSTAEAAATFTGTASLGRVNPDIATKTVTAISGVTLTAAYDRAYVTAPTQAALTAALSLLEQLRTDAHAQPSATPTPTVSNTRRTIKTTLRGEILQRLASVSGVKATDIDPGLYLVTGDPSDMDAFVKDVKSAEEREAKRVTIFYPDASRDAESGVKLILPYVTTRFLTQPDRLEVRATLEEHVQISAYLTSMAHQNQPEHATVTERVPLAYATPSTVAAQLTVLYAQEATPASAQTSIAQAAAPATPGSVMGTVSNAPTTSASAAPAPVPLTLMPAPQDASSATSNPSTPTLISGVRIVTDERSRALILTGPSSVITRIKRTIQDLDTRLQDVRMGVRIDQVNGSNGQDLGVNWSVGAGGFSIGHDSGTLTAGYAPGVSPLTFSANLNAARSQGRAVTLLDTTFVTQDGGTVTFKNGGELILANASTTTSGTTTTTTTTRERYAYGLDVQLTPKLAPDGRVELTVTVNLGQAPKAGLKDSLVIEKQTFTTRVTVEPGEKVLLGSVVARNEDETTKGVPLLSEIPVIGTLFSKSSSGTSNSVLLITLSAADRVAANAPASSTLRITTPGH